MKPDTTGIKTLDPDAIFSVAETAKLLGMTHNGVLMRIKRGQIRVGRAGARYFITGADIQKQLQLPYDI